MTPDYTAWRFWLDVLQVAGLVALGLYSWWRDREKVTAKRFQALEKDVATRVTAADLKSMEEKQAERCGRHKARTGQLEMDVRQLPGRAEIVGLSSDIRALTEKMGRMEGRLEGLNRLADLINEHLINKEK